MAVSSAEFYEVRWRVKDAGEAWSPPRRIAPTGEIVITELDRTQQYEFEVRAVSNCGAKSIWVPSDYTVPTVPPLPAVNVPAGSGMADGVQLDWGDGTSTRADLQYEISRAPAAGSYTSTPPPESDASWSRVAIVSGTTWLDAVTDTAAYWYRIRTVDYTGNVGAWTIISAPQSASISTPELAGDVAAATAAAFAADAKAAQEIIDRQLADAQVKIDAAQDAATKVQAEAQARADALLAENLAWTAAVTTETTQRQTADESLAQSISMVSAGSGEQFDSAQIWRFDTTTEGWSGNGTPTVVDGWLRPANQASNPYVQSPDNIGVDGSAYRYMKLRVKRVGSPVWRGAVQWTTTADNTFNATKQITIAEPGFDANGVATVDWQDIAWWPATIRRLRVLLSNAQTATDYYLLDWVAVGRPTPGASVALVQDVEQASINRDGAESLARQTLAAQMRGTYEGTDVAQVTQGLVWSERQARATAVSAEATRTDGIISQLAPGGVAELATKASVTDLATTTANATGAVSNRVGAVEARMPSGSDQLATDARVTEVEQASVDADAALAARTQAIEVRMPAGSDTLANEARVVSAEQAAATASGANAGRIDGLQARFGARSANLIEDGSFEGRLWTLGDGIVFVDVAAGAWVGCTGSVYIHSNARGATRVAQPPNTSIAVEPGRTYRIRCTYETNAAYDGTVANGKLRLGDQSGALVGNYDWRANKREVAEIVYTAPTSGAVSALRATLSFDHTNGWCRVDDVSCYDITDAIASAAANTATNVQVGIVDGKINAVSGRTTTLETTVGDNTTTLTSYGSSIDGIKAKAGVVANVSGQITGWQLLAGGGVSAMNMLADNFSVIGSSSTNYMSWTGGANGLLQLVSTATGGVLRMGGGFGAESDKLIFGYVGANSGAASTQTLAAQKVGFTASGRYKFGSTWGGMISGWPSGATISYTSTASAATINVAAGVLQIGDQTISYNAASVSVSYPGQSPVRYYMYFDDPGMAGGSLTLKVSSNAATQYNSDGRVLVGTLLVEFKSGGGGSGGPNCPARTAYVLRRRGEAIRWVRAKRVRAGDWLRVIDPVTGDLRWGLVTYSAPALADCVTVETDAGIDLTCSRTAPIGTPTGQVLAPDTAGAVVSGYADRFVTPRVTDVADAGRQWVQHIICEDTFFLAGNDAGKGLAHHNQKPTGP